MDLLAFMPKPTGQVWLETEGGSALQTSPFSRREDLCHTVCTPTYSSVIQEKTNKQKKAGDGLCWMVLKDTENPSVTKGGHSEMLETKTKE